MKCNFCAGNNIETGDMLFQGLHSTICEKCVENLNNMRLERVKKVEEEKAQRQPVSMRLSHPFKVINGGQL